jgi:hypothetical protein
MGLLKACTLSMFARAVMLFLACGCAFSQFTVTLTFDEFGTGRLTNSAGANLPLPSIIRADPGPGGLPAVLFYDMLAPPGLVTGDLLILEPTTGALSDILRFDAVRAGVFVYSDNSDGADAPADVGFPTGRYPNMFTITEFGPEGANGITYTPIAGQPGFVAGAAGPATYVFLSDGQVPEPSSLLLLGSGATVLLYLRLRSRRGRQRQGEVGDH